MRLCAYSLVSFSIALVGVGQAQVSAAEKDLSAQHRHGVELAHQGKHDQGLSILRLLMKQYPDNYPVLRDYIIITTWNGDCDEALQRYEGIRSRANQEPYLIAPVGECLAQKGSAREAIALLRQGLQRWPGDEELTATLDSITAEQERRLQSKLEITASTYRSSDRYYEVLLRTNYERPVADRTSIYAYLFTIRALRALDYEVGDLNRAGIGARYRFNPEWLLSQGVSMEAVRGNEIGITTTLVSTPSELWENNLEYTTFTEDLPLRAKGVDENARASRISAGTYFHTTDYRWEWSAAAAYYDFSDGNQRTTTSTALGYAIELKPRREQRFTLELGGSQNTKGNTQPYFNPIHDLGTTLTYQLDLVYDSRFQRHADHFYVHAGTYSQQGFGTKPIGGIRYEQEYEFNATTALNIGLAYNINAYDGAYDDSISLDITFNKRF